MSDAALASLRHYQIVLGADEEETETTNLLALYAGNGAQHYQAISAWDDSEIDTILEFLS
ncbi:hypothetical protein [Actinomyces trachealis]|uniref:hypothetical protein n=1 Tax=Actinomyces trachealis TaxID=2763540 RepID=UPI001892C996|nr:hypothetical protein [Actinomyces trachealis]